MKKQFDVNFCQGIVEDSQMVFKRSIHIWKAFSCWPLYVDTGLHPNIVTDDLTVEKMSHFYKLNDDYLGKTAVVAMCSNEKCQ